MNCAKVRELISDYADGLVSPRVHEEVSQHIAHCESCNRELETTTRMLSAASELGNKKVPVDLWPVVQVRIENLERSRQPLLRRVLTPIFRPIMAVPVAAAAAAVILVLAHSPQHPAAPQRVSPAGSAEMAAYVEEYSEFRSKQSFSDSSSLIVSELQEPAGKKR